MLADTSDWLHFHGSRGGRTLSHRRRQWSGVFCDLAYGHYWGALRSLAFALLPECVWQGIRERATRRLQGSILRLDEWQARDREYRLVHGYPRGGNVRI